MKRVLLFTLITIFLTSCGEKVKEVSDSSGSSGSSGEGNSEVPDGADTYFISLEETSDNTLSHYIHKPGESTEGCLLNFSSIPDAADYDPEDTDYAEDCIIDVEELDLYTQGFNLKLNVSAGLCEYIEIRPFSFFQYQPGATTGTIYSVQAEGCTSNAPTVPASDAEYFHSYTAATTTFATPVTAAENFCRFDYSDEDDDENEAPNCDIGNYTIKTVTFTPDETGDCGAPPAIEDEIIECGGSVRSCLGGPGADFLDNFPETTSQIISNLDLEQFIKEYEVSSPISNGLASNMSLANFMRSCSATTDGTTVTELTTNVSTHGGTNTVFSSTDFAGFWVEQFPFDASVTVSNDGADDLPLTSTGGIFSSLKYTLNNWSYITYSSSPFRSTFSAQTSPYYSVKCMDQARDVKAQLRLFVREWDRQFDPSSESLVLTQISDITLAATDAKMDNQEYPTNYPSDPWNDIQDWDDFLLSTLDSDSGDMVVTEIDGTATALDIQFTTDPSSLRRIDATCESMSAPLHPGNYPGSSL